MSASGWGCAPFLLVVWPEAGQSWSQTGSMVRLKATFQRICPNIYLPGLLLPVPRPGGRPMPMHGSAGDPQILTGRSDSSLLWGHCSFPLGPGVQHCFVCALQASPFSPVLWKLCNQIPLSFKVGFPGDSHPFAKFPGWEV